MSKHEGLPDIHDRVTEAYFGKMGGEFARSTRERVHWICAQVAGEHVLDVGCSQGIASILLGREGKSVTGVDVSKIAVDEAKAYLAEEADAVQRRVTFIQADLFDDKVCTGPFHTIIMAEVLEHLIYPEALVAAAAERVQPDGRLIVTVPFGVNDWPDHKHTFYLHEPWQLISAFFDVEDVMYFGKWIGFVAKRRTDIAKAIGTVPPLDKIAGLESAFQQLERGLLVQNGDLEQKLRAASAELGKVGANSDKAVEESSLFKAKVSELQVALKMEEEKCAQLESTQAAAVAARIEIADRLEELSVKIRSMESDNSELIDENRSLKEGLEFRDQLVSDLKSQIVQLSNEADIVEQQTQLIKKEKEGLIVRLALAERLKQDAEEKVERTKQTLSYRLGHALIFGFKSWSGFKALPGELWAVREEGKRRRLKKKAPALVKKSNIANRVSNPSLAEGAIYDFSNKKSAQTKNTGGSPSVTTTVSLKRPEDFSVAMVVDEFTYNSFRSEFNAVVIEPENWREKFEQERPDIFFCESAWSGVDTERRPWKGRVYASENFKNENRAVLLDILAYCRQEGIPTVFWNKEDPAHYSDRVHDFVKTAREFDHVFTSAIECVDKYKNDYGLASVYPLPFATNPRLFNPVQQQQRTASVVFAGSWYANHVQRSADMENMLDQLTEKGFPIEIYDRYYDDSDPLHQWPEKYAKFIRPGLPHSQMPEIYKSSIYGLNFNTVSTSDTMFARRVFELISSNTLVLSNYSAGVDKIFGKNVVFLDKEPGRLEALTPAEIDLIRENALHQVLRGHTYADRWVQILSDIGMPYRVEEASLTYAIIVHSEEEAQAAVAWFQQYEFAQQNRLLLIASLNIPDIELPLFYQKFNRFGVAVTSVSHAEKHALDGLYLPIETGNFLLTELKALPTFDWIENALLHLKYMTEQAISPSDEKEQMYRILPNVKGKAMLGKKEIFLKCVRSISKSDLVYYI